MLKINSASVGKALKLGSNRSVNSACDRNAFSKLLYCTAGQVDIQDVHLSPLAEFKSISTVDSADVKASIL